MKIADYLDACKAKLNLPSDYALAKACGISNGALAEIRHRKRAVSPYLAYWFAITLERDPAEVLAEIEEQQEKHEGRRDFWRSFRSRARTAAAVLCTLVSLVSAGFGSVPGGAGGGARWRLGFA